MVIESLESLTLGKYQSLARKLREEPAEGREIKLALLSSNSFSFLEPYIVVECARRNLAATPWIAPFGQIEQAVLSEDDGIASVGPDVVVVAMRIEDVFADAFLRPGGEQLADRANACIDRIENCVERIRELTDATVLVANFAVPDLVAVAGIFDAGNDKGPLHIVNAANAELATRLADKADTVVWDYAGLVRSRGTSTWTDERLWHLARQPIAGANLPHAAAHLARSIAGTVFQRAKCLVLDLDNTLWGGVAGDDGLSGIQVGDDYPGNTFKAFQSAVLSLRDRGVLLAIASKNDEVVVRQIFDEHPDLVVRWDDFSNAKVNWDAKSDNLKAIAAELNIGLDALAFFDDNPVEREEIRQHAPAVNVIDVPKSPIHYVEALLGSGLFDTPVSSSEDAARSRHYENEGRRQVFRKSAGSMEEFLGGLEMEITTGSVGPESIARVTQLIGKTNQVNLTSRRHSQSAVERMAEDEAFDVRWTRLADRYGDSGIIGVTVLHFEEMVATIDSFLMSCRVMGRQVEQAMLCDAIEQALARGCISIRGQFIATDRNSIVSDFYRDSGFTATDAEDCDGYFVLSLGDATARPAWPEVLRSA